MVPSGSVDLLPFKATELVGSVMDLFTPASATGAWLGAADTVTVTWSLLVALELSVTVSSNTYCPATRADAVGDTTAALLRLAAEGPLIIFQL